MSYIDFHNNTELPIMIDAWDNCKLKCIKIKPQEKLTIYSSVGEWHINAMFTNESDRKIWNDNGLKNLIIIGKFRSEPCASGNYSWMEYEGPFDCEYSKYYDLDLDLDKNIKGLITFKKNN